MRRLVLFAATALTLTAAVGRGQGDEEFARDRKRMQGVWEVAAYDLDGNALPADLVKTMSVAIQADRITIRPRVVGQRVATVKDGKTQAAVTFTTEPGKADEAKYRL